MRLEGEATGVLLLLALSTTAVELSRFRFRVERLRLPDIELIEVGVPVFSNISPTSDAEASTAKFSLRACWDRSNQGTSEFSERMCVSTERTGADSWDALKAM